jgi:hypothetical protein
LSVRPDLEQDQAVVSLEPAAAQRRRRSPHRAPSSRQRWACDGAPNIEALAQNVLLTALVIAAIAAVIVFDELIIKEHLRAPDRLSAGE